MRIETSAGVIDARIEMAAAPISGCNFLRYALGGYYDGGNFFRTVRSGQIVGNPIPIDVIQLQARNGEELDAFGPIRLERTSVTGLTHKAGALSMGRWGPDTATSSFSIVVKPSHEMDFGGKRNPDGQGFAVFGYVTGGMDVVRTIQLLPADDEQLKKPVTILRVVPAAQSSQAVKLARKNCPIDAAGMADKN